HLRMGALKVLEYTGHARSHGAGTALHLVVGEQVEQVLRTVLDAPEQVPQACTASCRERRTCRVHYCRTPGGGTGQLRIEHRARQLLEQLDAVEIEEGIAEHLLFFVRRRWHQRANEPPELVLRTRVPVQLRKQRLGA